MSEIAIIGIDLAKRLFQLHGARSDGSIMFRKRLSRAQLQAFVAQHSKCVIAIEACATAHGWGRDFEKLGHDVRLIPPINVKPVVKRQKNDAADAEGSSRRRCGNLRPTPAAWNALRTPKVPRSVHGENLRMVTATSCRRM